MGAAHVADRAGLESLPQARNFSFLAEGTTMEQVAADFAYFSHTIFSQAEREICRSLRLKDCQVWYVAEDGLCRKREVVAADQGDLALYMRHDAVYRYVQCVVC